MSSITPLSEPANIDFNGSDEEVMMCLEKIVSGAPLPPNVITEVNPYNVLPWDLPVDIWYLFNSEGRKATDTGYWKESEEDYRTFANFTSIGSRTTLEYYTGLAPCGRKTDFVMHEYQINWKQLCEVKNSLNFRSLSRVFLSYGQSSHDGQQCSNARTPDANGKMTKVDLNKENHSLDSTSGSKVFTREEGPLVISEEHIGHARPDHRTQGFHEIYDFSRGDFLELLDLDNPESSSSSSENSSCLTVSSDEYFDPLALLRDLGTEHAQDIQMKHTDSKCQVSAPLRPTKVVHKAESLGFCPGNSLSSSQNGENLMPDSVTPSLAIEQRFRVSKNSKTVISLPNVSSINRDQGVRSQDEVASSSQGIQAETAAMKSKGVAGRMKKLKKKYWCFMPF